MKLQIVQGREALVHEFKEGTVTLGGSPSDEIYVRGLPPTFLVMKLTPNELVVTPLEKLKVAGALTPAHRARLVFAMETIEVRRNLALSWIGKGSPFRTSFDEHKTSTLLQGLFAGAPHLMPSEPGVWCLTGREIGHFYPLVNGMCLGRAEGMHVRLRDRAVSHIHASIHSTREGYWVNNLGGSNGLYLNDRRIRRAAYLAHGDTIRLGQSIVRVVLPSAQEGLSAPHLPLLRSWEWIVKAAGETGLLGR